MPEKDELSDEQRKQIIDIWKAIVEVQKHFNDISMRIRGMFMTILLALFASIGFLLDKELSLRLGDVQIRFATVMPLFGIFATYLFYFMDRFWYHRLLVGAVNHGIQIEKKHKGEIPELALSDAIKNESSFEPHRSIRWMARLVVTDTKFKDTGRLHSDGKIEFFYKSVMCVLVLTMVLVGSLGGVTRETESSATASASDKVEAEVVRTMQSGSPQQGASEPINASDNAEAQVANPSQSSSPDKVLSLTDPMVSEDARLSPEKHPANNTETSAE